MNAQLIRAAAKIGRTEYGEQIAPYHLSQLAEVSNPDTRHSWGAVWLVEVFEDWQERVTSELEEDGATLEGINRDSVTRDVLSSRVETMSTLNSWRVFVDLGLWQWSYDLTEHTGRTELEGHDIHLHAVEMVYAAGRQLIGALFEALEAAAVKL